MDMGVRFAVMQKACRRRVNCSLRLVKLEERRIGSSPYLFAISQFFVH
jgi:hypothetical protein